ncbi:hypothetical protein LL947_09285 [Halomonas sp. BLK-85]
MVETEADVLTREETQMQLLVISYTPGSSLLDCLETDRIPNAGDIIEAGSIQAKVLYTKPLDNVKGYECAVVVDDLTVGDRESAWYLDVVTKGGNQSEINIGQT